MIPVSCSPGSAANFLKQVVAQTGRRNLWLIQDAHDPNDVADLTSQVNSMTGLIDTNSAGSVTTCQGGRSECKFVRVSHPTAPQSRRGLSWRVA